MKQLDTRNHKLILFFQIDACRYDYLSKKNTPFLFNLQKQGVGGALVPTFGFEPDAAYFSGLYPDEADGGAQFWLDPTKSPFGFTKYFSFFFEKLPRIPELIVRKTIQEFVKIFFHSPLISTARIPFQLLHYFSFPMQTSADHEKFSSNDTIFDLLRKQKLKWLFHEYPNNKVDLNSVIDRFEKNLFPPINFAFFHVGNLDSTGHQYGPDSFEMQQELKKVDVALSRMHTLATQRFDEVHFVVIGDHGMMTVDKTLDIQAELLQLPLELEKDYLLFLDSVMARFWFFNDKAEKIITSLLENMKDGHILSQQEKNHYHLNYPHKKFGDIIYIVNPGALIFPNFYQKRFPVKGMHGYAPKTPEQQSVLLINSPRVNTPILISQPVDMRLVFPTILDLLDLPVPDKCTLSSILDNYS